MAYRWEKTLLIYNVEQACDEEAITLYDGQNLRTVSFSPDGQRILVGCHDDRIQIYDLNGKLQGSWKGRAAQLVTAMEEFYIHLIEPQWSPCGNFVAYRWQEDLWIATTDTMKSENDGKTRLG